MDGNIRGPLRGGAAFIITLHALRLLRKIHIFFISLILTFYLNHHPFSLSHRLIIASCRSHLTISLHY